MKKNILLIKFFGMLSLVVIMTSCGKDFLEPTVSTSKDIDGGLTTAADLNGVMYGVLNRMGESGYMGRDVLIDGDVRSDNAFSNANSGRFVSEAQFFYTPEGGASINIWDAGYEAIASTNLILYTDVEDNDSPEVKHVKGQAYALRAMNYLTLLEFYGQQYTGGNLGVPILRGIVDSSNPAQPVRNTVDQVWSFIKSDLDSASLMMSEDLNGPSTEPTTYMVEALKTRVDLYTKDYQGVIDAAENLIASGQFDVLSGAAYVNSWRSEDSENVIFQLGMNDTDNLSINGLSYILRAGSYGDIESTGDLYGLYETGDTRLGLFTTTGGEIRTTKYMEYTDNVKLITYAEVMLNYAEALIATGDANALTALNMIPTNRNATLYTTATMQNVLLERRKELAMEGFRFYDLMRNEMDIPYVDPGQTFGTSDLPYGSYNLVLPIPRAELDANPNMEQNKNYAD